MPCGIRRVARGHLGSADSAAQAGVVGKAKEEAPGARQIGSPRIGEPVRLGCQERAREERLHPPMRKQVGESIELLFELR